MYMYTYKNNMYVYVYIHICSAADTRLSFQAPCRATARARIFQTDHLPATCVGNGTPTKILKLNLNGSGVNSSGALRF